MYNKLGYDDDRLIGSIFFHRSFLFTSFLQINELETSLSNIPKTKELTIDPSQANSQQRDYNTRHSPNVPDRETIQSPPNHIFGIKPPLVNRRSKPISPPPSPTKDFIGNDMVASNQTPIAPTASTQPEIADVRSDTDTPNPVPKPPRGHYVEDGEEVTTSHEPSNQKVDAPLTNDGADTGELPPPRIDRDLKPSNSVSAGAGINAVDDVSPALKVAVDTDTMNSVNINGNKFVTNYFNRRNFSETNFSVLTSFCHFREN